MGEHGKVADAETELVPVVDNDATTTELKNHCVVACLDHLCWGGRLL